MPKRNTDASRNRAPWSAAALGLVAGMRSQLPLAMLANAASAGQFAAGNDGVLSHLRSKWAPAVFDTLAAGEIAADKLPFVPPRTGAGSLAGREMTGALAGAAIFRNAGRPAPVGLALGIVGAAAGTFGGYYARSFLSKRTGLPDLVWAVAEDALAIGLGTFAVKRFFRS